LNLNRFQTLDVLEIDYLHLDGRSVDARFPQNLKRFSWSVPKRPLSKATLESLKGLRFLRSLQLSANFNPQTYESEEEDWRGLLKHIPSSISHLSISIRDIHVQKTVTFETEKLVNVSKLELHCSDWGNLITFDLPNLCILKISTRAQASIQGALNSILPLNTLDELELINDIGQTHIILPKSLTQVGIVKTKAVTIDCTSQSCAINMFSITNVPIHRLEGGIPDKILCLLFQHFNVTEVPLARLMPDALVILSLEHWQRSPQRVRRKAVSELAMWDLLGIKDSPDASLLTEIRSARKRGVYFTDLRLLEWCNQYSFFPAVISFVVALFSK